MDFEMPILVTIQFENNIVGILKFDKFHTYWMIASRLSRSLWNERNLGFVGLDCKNSSISQSLIQKDQFVLLTINK